MSFYVIHNSSGRILQAGFSPNESDIAAMAGANGYLLTDRFYSDSTHYVSDVQAGTISALQDLDITVEGGSNIVPADAATPITFVGRDVEGVAFVISGAGNPGVFGVVNDGSGELEVTFNWPARYQVQFSGGVAFKPLTIFVSAVAP